MARALCSALLTLLLAGCVSGKHYGPGCDAAPLGCGHVKPQNALDVTNASSNPVMLTSSVIGLTSCILPPGETVSVCLPPYGTKFTMTVKAISDGKTGLAAVPNPVVVVFRWVRPFGTEPIILADADFQ